MQVVRPEAPKPVPKPNDWRMHLPEGMVGKDGQVDVEKLGESYRHLRARLSMREDDLRKRIEEEQAVERAKAIGDLAKYYSMELPEGSLPEGIQLMVRKEDEPFVEEIRKVAAESGMSREAWQKLVATYARWRASELPDIDAELEKLGPNARQRLDRLSKFIGSKVSKDDFDAIASVAVRASVVAALERLVDSVLADQAMQASAAAQAAPLLTEQDVREMMRHPSYWARTEEGAQLRQQVQDWFRRKASRS